MTVPTRPFMIKVLLVHRLSQILVTMQAPQSVLIVGSMSGERGQLVE